MAVKEPESMGDLVYFTDRNIGKGNVRAWVYKRNCPKCGKAKMGKPVEKGKVKIRATEYQCPACKYTVNKEEYEETLTMEAKYICPKCSFKGEIEAPFIRKKMKLFDEETGKKATAEAVVFDCAKCGEKIAVTKKMK
jgi:predicted RNA-binding Zn-ribbon protein involved in translation (DUF1610 family)